MVSCPMLVQRWKRGRSSASGGEENAAYVSAVRIWAHFQKKTKQRAWVRVPGASSRVECLTDKKDMALDLVAK